MKIEPKSPPEPGNRLGVFIKRSFSCMFGLRWHGEQVVDVFMGVAAVFSGEN